jgi:hypothetical protein
VKWQEGSLGKFDIPHFDIWCCKNCEDIGNKVKTVPLQAWSGQEGSRKLKFPDYMTTAQDGGKVVSLTYRPPLKKLKQSRYVPAASQEVKAVPLQACSGPEGSRKLKFPDYMTTAQDGGKVVSLTYRPPLKKLKQSRYRPGVAQRFPES